jgi:YHS domain-containing protein/uncharacterized membrane protein YraQ (UPF0718 family)
MTQFFEAIKMSFFMLWETLWALVLGFGLSGVVQAFVSKEAMERSMGDHRPPAVARASVYGTVSSSCSYAATAMGKSLFQKGADFTTAMVFMFASTNLVIELGVVLLILLGWQFMAAEFVGGPIMIALLALVGGFAFHRRITEPARERLRSGRAGGHDHQAMVGVSEERQEELERTPWHSKLTSKAAWADAASYTMADIKMLRRELVIGYVVAGFIAVYVSHEVWRAVFFQGHGFLTTLENAIVGPFIAVVSFVCSIGNVPLAAALWHGGLAFGGVIAFIFADQNTFPLLLIYRKYYGAKLALRLLVTFWIVMSAAGAVTELIFQGAGWIPQPAHGQVVHTRLEWNYTTFLNFVFLAVFGVLYWLYRNREKFGGGKGYAIDPICGMQVRTSDAPASTVRDGKRIYFCSDRCLERFERSGVTEPVQPAGAVDPICGMSVDPSTAAAERTHQGVIYWFCSEGCAQAFDADPARATAGARRRGL